MTKGFPSDPGGLEEISPEVPVTLRGGVSGLASARVKDGTPAPVPSSLLAAPVLLLLQT